MSEPQAGRPEPIRSVAVIGAGQRGRAFALHCARAGLEVILEDVLSSKLRKAEEQIAQESQALRNRLQLASSVEDAVRDADIAIDFVPDELESKLEIFCLVDRMAPPRTMLCTPTTLSISDLASCTYRADRCLGLQPFGDAVGTTMRLVRGEATSEQVVDRVVAWLAVLGAVAEVTTDTAPSGLVRDSTFGAEGKRKS